MTASSVVNQAFIVVIATEGGFIEGESLVTCATEKMGVYVYKITAGKF